MRFKLGITNAFLRGASQLKGYPGRVVPALRGRESLDRTTYHEAGHALVNHYLADAGMPISLTDRPRLKDRLGGTRGLFRSFMDEDLPHAIEHQLIMTMAGRATEIEVFGSPGDDFGNSGDFALARHFIKQLHGEVSPERETELIAAAEEKAAMILRGARPKLDELADALREKHRMDVHEIQAVLGERFTPTEDSWIDHWNPENN